MKTTVLGASMGIVEQNPLRVKHKKAKAATKNPHITLLGTLNVARGVALL
jgi:hypothetical protein